MSTQLTPFPDQITLAEGEMAEWFALPLSERVRVKHLVAAFAVLSGAKGGRLIRECKRVAEQMQRWIRRLSWKTLYRLFNEWEATGKNWRVLVRNYNCGQDKLTQNFAGFFVGLVGESSRADAVRAARERLLVKWYANDEIPGYGRLADWWRIHRPGLPLPEGRIERVGDTPRGWSETNLRRYLPRRRAIRTLMREGFHAAHGDLPQLLRDRSLLRPLGLIVFDDVRLDLQTVMEVDGKFQTAYVNAMFAIDVRTGIILNYGLKPRLLRDDKTRTAITRAEVRFLLLRILENIGLPPWTVNILLENAAAALVTQDKDHLKTVFGDRIAFDTTGMMRRTLLKSGFLEEGGMPWQHGWIEAYFRKLHGALAHLDGATGRRYELDPGDRQGREKYALSVLKRGQAEGVNTGDLWLPFLRHGEAEMVVAEVVQRLNWRTKHQLQGFVKVFEYHHPEQGWLNDREFMALTAGEREICRPADRLESPAECMARLLHGVEVTKPTALALLPLYEDRRPVKIRGGKVNVKLDETNVTFWEENHPVLIADENEARELIGIVANDRSCLHLLTPELSFLGTVARQGLVSPLNDHGTLNAAGAVHRSRQAVAKEAATYLAPREARYAAGRAHNAAVFARAAGVGAAMVEGEQRATAAARKTTKAQRQAAREQLREEAELAAQILARSNDT